MWHEFKIPPSAKFGAVNCPAPILIENICLRSSWGQIPVLEPGISGILDTGSDLTVIPKKTALKMKLESAGHTKNVKVFDSSVRIGPQPKFRVELFLPALGWIPLVVIGTDRADSDVLLGRDVCERMLLSANWRQGGFGVRPAVWWHGVLRCIFWRLRKPGRK